MWVGIIIKSVEGLNWTKEAWRICSFPPVWAGILVISCSQAGTSIIGSPASQAFGLWLNYIASFPGSPDCRQQIRRLLSLHNYISQTLTINKYILNKSYIIFYWFYWFCFSGEMWYNIMLEMIFGCKFTKSLTDSFGHFVPGHLLFLLNILKDKIITKALGIWIYQSFNEPTCSCKLAVRNLKWPVRTHSILHFSGLLLELRSRN